MYRFHPGTVGGFHAGRNSQLKSRGYSEYYDLPYPFRSPGGNPERGATVWAEVKGISGRERISGGAETAQTTVRVWMQIRRDVTAASRLKVLTGRSREPSDIKRPPSATHNPPGLKYFAAREVECDGF